MNSTWYNLAKDQNRIDVKSLTSKFEFYCSGGGIWKFRGKTEGWHGLFTSCHSVKNLKYGNKMGNKMLVQVPHTRQQGAIDYSSIAIEWKEFKLFIMNVANAKGNVFQNDGIYQFSHRNISLWSGYQRLCLGSKPINHLCNRFLSCDSREDVPLEKPFDMIKGDCLRLIFFEITWFFLEICLNLKRLPTSGNI